MAFTVIHKRFLLAGYEITIDLDRGFAGEMEWIQAELKRSLSRIGNMAEPVRLIGFWQPWQAFIAESDQQGAANSKARYFFGVEVSNLDDLPSDCVVKAVPESDYVVCREEHRGTAPKAEMYALSGYGYNHQIAGDFEIFDGFDLLEPDDPCDILVPVKPVEP
jgi:hypothetical protein